ncbi:MAG: hypothetical protein IJW00_08865 [Clostridia bacterium]|nr:hypothetical protein [Clostridia bacterium]
MNKKSCLLPRLHRKDSHVTRSRQTIFGGLSSCPEASSGEITEMAGLSPRAYPAIGTLEPRFSYDVTLTAGTPNGLCYHDTLVMARGEGLYKVSLDGEIVKLCTVSDTPKTFASFGNKLFVLPDRICVDTAEGTLRSLDIQTDMLTDAVLGVNFITHTDTDWGRVGFAVGDAVEINVKDYILGSTAVFTRRISDINGATVFFDTAFERTGTFALSVNSAVPTLTHLCVLGDRLLGTCDNRVYISEAGNPFNWTFPSGEDSDPLILDTGGSGEITACASCHGSAVFFKEDRIYQLTGHSARDYMLVDRIALGVSSDSAASLCEVGGDLYYLSAGGVCCFDGDRVSVIGPQLPVGLTGGVGGSDGACYYLAAWHPDGTARMYAYHCGRSTWMVLDMIAVISMATWGDLLFIQTKAGSLLRDKRVGEALPTDQTKITETASVLPSRVVFGEEFGNYPDGLRLLGIHLHAQGASGSVLRVEVSYDGGPWTLIGSVNGEVKNTAFFPVRPKRAGAYRLRLTMTGKWRISEIVCDYEKGKQ